MGGMGRVFDGGYAEYTVVPRDQVVPFTSDLPWHVIGAVPETLQTAYGSLTTGLDLSEGQTLLVRGGTSSVGLAAITVAKDRNATVVATTRRPDRTAGTARPRCGPCRRRRRRDRRPGARRAGRRRGRGARARRHPDAAGHAARHAGHGTVCFTGMLSNQWTVPDFYPIDYLPRGVRLTAYGGDSTDLPPEGAAGLPGPPRRRHRQPRTDQGAPAGGHPEAHADLEHNRTFGKHVVLTDVGRPA